MATETQKLLIEIEVDADQATKAIVNQKQALEQLKKEKADLIAQNKELAAQENVDTAAIQKNNEAIVQKEAKIKNLSTEIKSNEKIVQAATKTTNDETGAYQQLALQYQVAAQKAKDMAVVHGVNSDEAKKATKAASDMSDQLKEVDASVGQNQRSVGDYGLALRGLGGNFGETLFQVNDFTTANGGMTGSLKAAGSAVLDMGKQLLSMLANPVVLAVAAVAGLVAGIGFLVKNSMEFSKEMSTLSAITGATGDDLNLLKERAKELGAQYGISAVEVVNGMKLVGSAKPELLSNVQALSDVTEAVMVLAKATGMDLAEATAGTTTIMNQFSLGADEVNRVINTLAAGSKYGAVEVDYLKEAISKVGTIANSANVTLEQSVAVMELFGEKGIKAESAGTGFKSMLGKLQADAKNYTNGVFDLNKAIDNNASISKDNLELQKKFGAEFYGMAGILFDNKERFRELTEQVTDTQTAYEQMRIANDNLQGDLNQMKSTWGSFLLTIEDGDGIFASAARYVVKFFTGLLNDLTLFGKDAGNIITFVTESFQYLGLQIESVGTTISSSFKLLGETARKAIEGDFKGISDSFDVFKNEVKDAWDSKRWDGVVESTRKVKAQEQAIREGAKQAKISAEEQKTIDDEKAKRDAENEKKAKDFAKAREERENAQLKKQQNNITILKNAYTADYEDSKLIDKNYFDSKQKALTDIHNAEIALIDKKKQYGKLTIEEEKIARAEANKSYVDSQNKLSADLNEELAKRLSAQFKLEELQLKKQMLGVKKNEAERLKATIDGIDKRYEQEKKLIGLTVTDEADKAEKLKLLNAQYNLDIATENQLNFERNKAQKLADEAGFAQAEFDLRKDTIDKEFDQKKAALEKERDERLKLVSAGSEAEFAIKQLYDEKEGELDRLRNLAKAQNIVDWAGKLADIMSGVIDVLNAFGERELANFEKVKKAELAATIAANDAAYQSTLDSITKKYNDDLAALDKQLADKLITQAEYDTKKKELDKNYSDAKKALEEKNADAEKKIQDELDEKKAEIEYQAAKRAKALAIVNAIINGASGVIAALATPIIGPILAIAAGVVAAANLAAIIATPIPDNRKGGGGSSGGGGGLPSTAGLGEALNGGGTNTTTNGIVTGNANGSDVVNNQNLINEINKNGGQQPVLVTSDLTKVQERQVRIEVMNEI